MRLFRPHQAAGASLSQMSSRSLGWRRSGAMKRVPAVAESSTGAVARLHMKLRIDRRVCSDTCILTGGRGRTSDLLELHHSRPLDRSGSTNDFSVSTRSDHAGAEAGVADRRRW